MNYERFELDKTICPACNGKMGMSPGLGLICCNKNCVVCDDSEIYRERQMKYQRLLKELQGEDDGGR